MRSASLGLLTSFRGSSKFIESTIINIYSIYIFISVDCYCTLVAIMSLFLFSQLHWISFTKHKRIYVTIIFLLCGGNKF